MIEGTKLIRQIYESSKQNLERDGFLNPACFIIRGDEVTVVDVRDLMKGDDNKDKFAAALRSTLQSVGATGVLLLTEAWFLDAAEADEYQNNPGKYPRPSEHPKRKEAVHFNFEDLNGPIQGKANILRGPTGTPKLCDLVIYVPESSEGRFTNFLKQDGDHVI